MEQSKTLSKCYKPFYKVHTCKGTEAQTPGYIYFEMFQILFTILQLLFYQTDCEAGPDFTESCSCAQLLHVKRPLKQQDCCVAWKGGVGSNQEHRQHGISTFLTFSHTVMPQSADWRSSCCLHGNPTTNNMLQSIFSILVKVDQTGSTFHSLLLQAAKLCVHSHLYSSCFLNIQSLACTPKNIHKLFAFHCTSTIRWLYVSWDDVWKLQRF